MCDLSSGMYLRSVWGNDGEDRSTAGAFTHFPATGREAGNDVPFTRSCRDKSKALNRAESKEAAGDEGLATVHRGEV